MSAGNGTAPRIPPAPLSSRQRDQQRASMIAAITQQDAALVQHATALRGRFVWALAGR